MGGRKQCVIASYDYLDLDVYWNARLFYQSMGYRVRLGCSASNADLLVVLRGSPKEVDTGFRGVIHVYSYVGVPQEDCREHFPNAGRIFLISLVPPERLSPNVIHVEGYLPVIPGLWFTSLSKADGHGRPVHISNYKEIGGDRYQEELLQLARSGDVDVYGSGWSRHGVNTGRISHWQANLLLARSPCCFGLMYPHQRGLTLSGRMWQAPLQGCYVITEQGTNIIRAPGVVEVGSFLESPFPHRMYPSSRENLRREAAGFWIQATERLAHDLRLAQRESVPQRARTRGRILISRGEMLAMHLSARLSRELNRFRAWGKILLVKGGRLLRGAAASPDDRTTGG